jgi:hypothetical protein
MRAGREAVGHVFPSCHIEWDAAHAARLGFPVDWRQFSINVPAAARVDRDHKLPLEITRFAASDDWTQNTTDALAFLMAMAVRQQGVRSAHFFRDQTGAWTCNLYRPNVARQ